MKKLLTTSMLCMFVGANAAPLGDKLLESVPMSSVPQTQNAKESSDDGVVVLVSNKPSDSKSDKSKLAEAKNKKHQHKKRAKHGYKHSAANYNQSYDVNQVFMQQQEQANKIMAKTNQINDAAQKVAKDASIQAQKTQELLKAQKAAQASANETISSANELNKLSISLQKNINSTPANVETPDNNLIEVESFND